MPTVEQTRYDKTLLIIETRCGGSKTKFAELMGVTKQHVSNLTTANDPKPIGKQFARNVEKVFGMPAGWMDEMTVSASVVSAEDSVEIPMLDTRGVLGPGLELNPNEEVVRKIWINTQWLREEVRGTGVRNLAVITGKGDSMSPTINSDTPLLIDTSQNAFNQDAIYVFTDGNQLFINRIQRKIGGKGVTVLSDNANYPPRELTEDDLSSIRVLGRAIRRIRFESL